MDKKYLLLLFIILHVWSASFAQDPSKLNENFSELFDAKNDSDKVDAYSHLGFNFSLLNPDSGIYFSKKGLELARKINYVKGIGDCYNSLGWCYSKKGMNNEAGKYLEQAKIYFEKTGNNCYVSVAVGNIGNLYFNQNRYAEALENFLRSVELSKNCPDKGFKSSKLYAIGAVYNSQKEYKKAIAWFREANVFNFANADTVKMAECINGIGNAWLGLQQYDSAMFYFHQSVKLFEDNNNLNGIAYSNESIGGVYQEQKNYTKALEHYEIALKNFRALNSRNDECYELITIGETYEQKGDLKAAILCQQRALQIADSNSYLSLKQKALTSLSRLSAAKNDYKSAYEYFRQASAVNDSLGLQQQQIKLNELKTKFETEQKDKEIALIKKDKELQEAMALKQRQLKNIFIAGAVVLLFIALGIYNRYNIKRKAEIQLTQKNKLIQEEKERAKQSEEFKQQFLANMSHEIRTPLNAICGMTELLSEEELSEQQKKYIDVISASAAGLLSIINDVLDLSKVEAGKLELEKIPVDIRKLTQEVYNAFEYRAGQKNISFATNVDAGVPQVIRSDAFRIRQILVNLLGNAFKFTEKGSVQLTVKSSPLQNHSDNRILISFSVADTGIGILPENQEKIFESFIQSDTGTARLYGGTGLGLNISKNLATLFGGTITLDSTPGKGSVFTFSMPCEVFTASESEQPTNHAATVADLKKEIHVLLIEDNVYNRMLATDALEKKIENIKINVFENGRQALAFMQTQNREIAYDTVILLDVQMPDMDGYEVARQIRNNASNPFCATPIIAVTANAFKEDIERCKAAGMNDVIAKPYKTNVLVQAVLKYAGQTATSTIEQTTAVDYKQEITNIDYLYEFTGGDMDEVKKYAEIFREAIPQRIEEAEKLLRNGESDAVIRILHSIKPMIVSFGLTDCETIITHLEQNRKNIKPNQLLPDFIKIRKQSLAAVDELSRNFNI